MAEQLAELENYKQQLALLLTEVTPDDSLILGILNFGRAKVIPLIMKDFNDSIKSGFASNTNNNNDDDSITPAQQHPYQVDKSFTAEFLTDKMWSEFYHPVFRYYQAVHHSLKAEESRHRKKTVELRKLNTKFLKVAKIVREFFHDLIKQILTQYSLGFQVPNAIYKFLELDVPGETITIRKSDQNTIIKLIYVIHASMLHISATSRYVSTLAQLIGGKHSDDFHKALDMARCAELLIPALGEARNQIGMTYMARGETLNYAYEFLRSSLSRIPSKFGALNYKKMMSQNAPLVEKLNKTKMENKCTKKNRQEYIGIYFLAIVGFYTRSSWKREEDGALINGMRVEQVEKDFLSIVKAMATEQGNIGFFFEKLLLILIGSIAQISKGSVSELTSLLKFSFKYIVALESVFIELFPTERKRSLTFLPTFRILVSWLKAQKMALAYSHKAVEFIQTSAQLINLIVVEFPEEPFENRPKRDQYFAEDVSVKEFMPLGRMLWDFDDDQSEIFNDPAKLIGQFAEHDFEDEDRQRLLSIGTLLKSELCARDGVTYNDATREVVLDLSKIIRKKGPKPKAIGLTPSSTNKCAVNTDDKKGQENGKKNKNRKFKSLVKGGNNKESQKKHTKNKGNTKYYVECSDGSDSDVEQLTEEVYNRHNEQISERFKPLEHAPDIAKFSKPTQIVLEGNASDQKMTQMVNSIVDDVVISSGASTENSTPSPVAQQQPLSPQQFSQSPVPQNVAQQYAQYQQQVAAQYQQFYGGIWSQNSSSAVGQFNPYAMYQQHGGALQPSQPTAPISHPQPQQGQPEQYPYYNQASMMQIPSSYAYSQQQIHQQQQQIRQRTDQAYPYYSIPGMQSFSSNSNSNSQ